MMQIVHCDQCNGSNIGLDSVSVNVELQKTVRTCDKCNNIHTEKTSYFFCSLMCFHTYMARVVNKGDASFDIDRYKHNVTPVQIAK